MHNITRKTPFISQATRELHPLLTPDRTCPGSIRIFTTHYRPVFPSVYPARNIRIPSRIATNPNANDPTPQVGPTPVTGNSAGATGVAVADA